MSGPSSEFDERGRRRPGFDPDSVPVDLGGARLYLPRPRLTIRRRHDERGRSIADPARTFGADYDALVEAVTGADGMAGLAAALFDLTADLLRRNYEVSEDELDRLLSIDPSEWRGADGVPEPWATVWEVARGLGPKSSAAGSSPPA